MIRFLPKRSAVMPTGRSATKRPIAYIEIAKEARANETSKDRAKSGRIGETIAIPRELKKEGM